MSNGYSWAVFAAAAVLLSGGLNHAAGQRLSETDVVRETLERSTDIRVVRITRAGDSLSLYDAEGKWLPSATIGSSGAWRPGDSSTISAAVSGAVAQGLPGGGSISAGVSPSLSHDVNSGQQTHATEYSASLTQPLAAGAWKYGQPGFDLRIQRLQDAESGLEFKKSVGAKISKVRDQYWSCYESQKALLIARESLAQAERVLVKDRVRYEVGEIAVIDTLGTALEWLQAQQSVLNAEIAYARERRFLALTLARTSEQVAIPESIDIVVSELPPAGELLGAARVYDPQRSIFQLAYERLQLQLGEKRNALLPHIDLAASYAHNDARRGDGSLANNSVVSLIFSYALPTRSGAVEVSRARLSLEQNRIESEQHDRELVSSVEALVEDWKLELRRLETAQVAAEVARRRLNAAQMGYEVGTVDQLTYLQARKDAFENETAALQQQVSLKRLEITFDEITGTVFSRFGVSIE
jgi:outer membrane protein TolC